MLDFILELERILNIWPDNTRWNVLQLAAQARVEPPIVVTFIAEALGKQVDVHEPLTFNEINRSYGIMLDRKHGEFELRRQREQQAMQRAVSGLDSVMARVRSMSASKNWRGAYRTLSYFFGLNERCLPATIIIQTADDCLRLGMKAEVNFQEMSQWFSRGFRALTLSPTADSVLEALDFLEAYGEYFIKQSRAQGDQYLSSHLLRLKPQAMEFDLMPRLNAVASDLGLTAVLDVSI